MNTNYSAEFQPWGKKVFQHFKEQGRNVLMNAFRFNPLGWKILFASDCFNNCAQVLKKNIHLWTPLNISLLQNLTPSAVSELSVEETSLALEELLISVRQALPEQPPSCKALEIALHICERYSNEEISNILPFLSGYGEQESNFDRELWIHVFAILDSLLDAPDEFYLQILKNEPTNDAVELVSLAILSQSVSEEKKKERFENLLYSLDNSERITILQYLYVRGVLSISKYISEVVLQEIDSNDIFGYQIKRIPVYKRQKYLQEVDYYLALCSIAQHKEDFDRGISKYGRWLKEYGFAVEYQDKVILRSQVLFPDQLQQILSSENFWDWKNFLSNSFFEVYENTERTLKFFFQFLHQNIHQTKETDALFLQIMKKPSILSYYRDLFQKAVEIELGSKEIYQLRKLAKTVIADYGIDIPSINPPYHPAPEETLYWAWLDTAVHGASYSNQSEIMAAYAQIEDWSGVIETAQWILEDRELTSDGNLLFAKALLSLGEVEESISTIRSLLVKEPKNAQASLLMGLGYVSIGNYQLAVDHLGRAVEFDSKNAAAWIALADAQKQLGRTDLAVATLKKGSLNLENEPQLSYELSKLLFSDREFSEAYGVIDGIHDYLISNAERFSYLLDLLWKTNNLPYVQSLVFGVGERFITEQKVVYSRAKIYQIQHKYKEALQEIYSFLTSTLTADSCLYEIYFHTLDAYTDTLSLAVALMDDEEIERINKAVNLALLAEPENKNYLIYQAEIHILDREYEEALHVLQTLLLGKFSHEEKIQSRIEFDIALCMRYLGEFDTAMASLNSLLENRNSDYNVLMQMAETCLANEILPQAEKYADEALAQKPDSQFVVCWFQTIIEQIQGKDQMSLVLEKILNLYPHSVSIKKEFIKFHLQDDHLDSVQKVLEKIIENDLGIPQSDRIDLVQYALESHSLELATRLIDAGGDTFELPVTLLIHYLIFMMQENHFTLVRMLIHQNQQRFENHRLFKVLEADTNFYLGRYDEAEALLKTLLKDTKQLNVSDFSGEDTDGGYILPYSSEELTFHQSPASLFLRLSLIARKKGDIEGVRMYSEKALAFDLNNPLGEYAFALGVRLNGDNGEISKLNQLFIHWQKLLHPELTTDDYLAVFRHNLYAECLMSNTAIKNVGDLEETLSQLTFCSTKLNYVARRADKQLSMDELVSIYQEEKNANLKYRLCRGFSSIFYQFMLDDTWLMTKKELSGDLIQIWPLVSEYYRENPNLLLAQHQYCDFGIRILILEKFYQELMITGHLPSCQFDLMEVKENIQKLIASASISSQNNDLVTMWSWFQAIETNTVILIDFNTLIGLENDNRSFFVAAARLTKTVIPVEQLELLHTNESSELLTQISLHQMVLRNNEDAWDGIKNAMANAADSAVLRFCYAKAAFLMEHYDAAIEGLQAAINLWPEETEWYRWAAKVALANYQFEDALYFLLYLQENDLATNAELVQLVRTLIHQKALNKASRMVAQIADTPENTADRIALLLMLAIKKGDASSVPVLFRDLNCADELSQEAYLAMAEYELQNGRKDAALNIAQVVYQYSPQHPQTLLILAKCLVVSGHNLDAKKILHQIPQNVHPSVHVARLQILKKISDDELLHSEIESAYENYPDDPDICYFEARALADRGDYRAALGLLGTIFHGEEAKVEHHSFAGWLHNELGNLDKAVMHLNQALTLVPQDAENLLLLATVHLKRRETKTALGVYQKGIQALPGDYRFYYEAGRLMREMKLYSEAEYMFRKASEIVPDRKDIRNQLGAIMALNFVHNAH